MTRPVMRSLHSARIAESWCRCGADPGADVGPIPMQMWGPWVVRSTGCCAGRRRWATASRVRQNEEAVDLPCCSMAVGFYSVCDVMRACVRAGIKARTHTRARTHAHAMHTHRSTHTPLGCSAPESRGFLSASHALRCNHGCPIDGRMGEGPARSGHRSASASSTAGRVPGVP
jgi:hypothetical protein